MNEDTALEAPDRIVPLRELASRWNCEVTTLRDARFRRRVGLVVVRVGRRLVGARASHILQLEREEV